MEWWQAIVLGVVQGVTEFLPISSDGHLILAQHFIGLPRVPLTFDVLVHAGTLVTMIFFFWEQCRTLRWAQWKVLAVATIPAVIFGVLVRGSLEEIGNTGWAVGAGFWITALFLFLADALLEGSSWRARIEAWWSRFQVKLETWPTWQQGFVVGVAQALAILPGVSRSGSTLMAGTVMGLSRKAAFEFAFLVGIPVIACAVLVDLLLVVQSGEWSQYPWPQYILATVVASVSGFFALKLLEYVMVRSRLKFFAVYCLVVGVLSVLFV